ncbi:hypothetical protein Tco_0224666 [Tanacetum coccineum]
MKELELEEAATPSDSDPLLPPIHQNVDSQTPLPSPSPSPSPSPLPSSGDEEEGSIATCRICLECDGPEGGLH